MFFSEIIGQSDVKEQLRNMIRGDRMPHALMLLGPSGSGKLPLALAAAQYLLCEDRQAEEPCGRCRACVKAAKFIHPDIHFSFPTVGTNVKSDQFLPQWRDILTTNPYLDINDWYTHIGAENKQGNINKEECNNIIRKLSLKIFEGSHKVLIMWRPEFLGKEGNRLLKLIEEPPENTRFLLIAENQELILNTILSRCQLIKVNALEDQDVIAGLHQKKEISADEAAATAHLANGDFNEALKMTVQREDDHAPLFLEWMRLCYQGNGVKLVEWVERFAQLGREPQKQFLHYALHFMREFMLVKVINKTDVRLRPNELKTATNLTKVMELDQVEQLAGLFSEVSYYIERNANPKVLFLDTSIRMHKIMKRKNLEVA